MKSKPLDVYCLFVKDDKRDERRKRKHRSRDRSRDRRRSRDRSKDRSRRRDKEEEKEDSKKEVKKENGAVGSFAALQKRIRIEGEIVEKKVTEFHAKCHIDIQTFDFININCSLNRIPIGTTGLFSIFGECFERTF